MRLPFLRKRFGAVSRTFEAGAKGRAGSCPLESGGWQALMPNTSLLEPKFTTMPLTGARRSIASTTTEVSRPITAGFDSRTSSTCGAGPVPAAQRDRVTVSLINVTAPLRAKSLPFTVAPLFTEIDVKAMTVPWSAVLVPSVAELPTCQKTLHAWAPLMRLTPRSVAVVSVDATWKMNTARGSPCASSVRRPVNPSEGTDPVL